MLIDDINELPPGHFVKLNGGGIDISPYWNLEPKVFDKNKYLNQSDIEKHLFHLLHNAVTSRMVSAVPTGVFLSGGVDSSAITAIMSLYQNDPVNTFTLHLDDVRLDEAKNAAQFAKLYSCQHHNIVVNSVDCHIQVANFLSKVDSPSMDGLNTYLISAAASNAGMRVMLSGLGGDELFAGYPGFRFAKQLQQFKMIFDNTRLLRKMIASGFSGLHLLKAFPLFRLLSANSHNISDSYPAFRQVMSLGETRKYIKADENPSLKITQKILDFEKSDEDLQLGMYSLAEYTHYAVNTLLRDNDQVGMANSIEIREPFFDYNLIEFVAGLPDTLKLGKYPKQLLVDAMYPLLPKEINMQTKKGFVLPMEKWMRNELRDLCEKSIYSICDRDFIHRSNLLEAWRNFLNGHYGVRWTTMWQFVVLGAWMDKNNIS
jgi:asparagine synthase (glutamine-hydrolysing)